MYEFKILDNDLVFSLLMTCNFKYQFDSEELVYFLGLVRGQCQAVLFATLKNLLQGAFTFFYFYRNRHKSVSSNVVTRNYSFKCFLDSFIWLNRQKGHQFRTFFSVPKKLSLQKSCIWEKLFYFLQLFLKCGEDIHPVQVSEIFTCEQLGLELVCNNVL